MKRLIPLFLSALLCLSPLSLFAAEGLGLEMSNPETLQIVYSIEPDKIEQETIVSLVSEMAFKVGLELEQRDDAQLHLRVEEHAGSYLLYLDFSREIYYRVDGNCYSKQGFVWGRYAKDIVDVEQLHEDIQFLFDEFLDNYLKANRRDS